MKRLLVFILIILMGISIISALCEEGQIDINKASKEELDDLYGIGPVKAEEIINSRPFESVNELIEVSGIGNITLNKIKEQGLACVNGETEKIVEEEEKVEENKEINETPQNNENLNIPDNSIEELKAQPKDIRTPLEPNIIKLNTKTIKSEDDKENSDKNNYAMYGFVIFCVLLGFLLILRKNKFNKNEFEG